ncbi:cell division cycle protein-like protein 23 [Xylaria longipes]|nr:cell division cycle protein-like protein 23 [Xylaria longipes]
MSLSQVQTLELKQELQQAVLACSERCLFDSAKWAAELLHALPNDENDATVDSSVCHAFPMPKRNPSDLLLEQIETPKYLLAKAFFHCHEYRRCADTLLPTIPSGHSTMFRKDKPLTRGIDTHARRSVISQRGLFLALYALLILGEKQKTEDAAQVLGPSDTGVVANEQLLHIRSILEKWFIRCHGYSEYGPSQGWLEYLYGMVLAKQQNRDLAMIWILKSVKINPWNWGAWQELYGLVRNAQHLDSICSKLQPSIMACMFSIYTRQELHLASTSLLSDISKLQIVFPGSLFLQGQEALVYHRMNDFASARSIFSEMLVSNPRYFDFLEHYSNVLYKLKSRAALAFAAQLASSVELYRPETCCAIGYFYSISSRHEDAIVYFRRAVTLDRSCTSAWTFLGHKFMDVGNFHAALSSYLRSIGLNQHDYRAFYGLGKAYEALEKPNTALYYYRRAVALRPDEMGLWQTMGNCMAILSKVPQAITALKRAIECSSAAFSKPDEFKGDIALLRLQRVNTLFQSAELYEKLHNRQEATSHLEQCLDEAIEHFSVTRAEGHEHDKSMSSVVPKSLLLLARWALNDGDHTRARQLASQVEQSGEFGEEALRLLNTCDPEEDKGHGQ